MCPDRELNPQPFGAWDDAQANWATWPQLEIYSWNKCSYRLTEPFERQAVKCLLAIWNSCSDNRIFPTELFMRNYKSHLFLMNGIQVRWCSLEMNCLVKLSEFLLFSSFLKLELNTLIYFLTLHKKSWGRTASSFAEDFDWLQNQPVGHIPLYCLNMPSKYFPCVSVPSCLPRDLSFYWHFLIV